MPLRLYYDGKQASDTLTASMGSLKARMLDAMRQTATAMARDIHERAKADIAAAGAFGSAWQNAVTVNITEGGANIKLAVTISAIENVPNTLGAFNIFEYGGVIVGKPMLWIPIPGGEAEQGQRAADLGINLIRVTSKTTGNTVLLDPESDRAVYFGESSVTIPQKFHLREIIADVGAHFQDYYTQAYSSGKPG
jgi:hypothetical protein